MKYRQLWIFIYDQPLLYRAGELLPSASLTTLPPNKKDWPYSCKSLGIPETGLVLRDLLVILDSIRLDRQAASQYYL